MRIHVTSLLLLIILLCNLNCFAAVDFTHTLDLAKHSSCSYIAEKFDTLSRFDGFGKLVEKELNIKKENLFPWRFEVTNGYQEGFVYFALLGYANELSGDIPFAYRCYQNATLYIDEEKSFYHPEPTAELYLGIARTCLAAGRYIDAKDWLDSAYSYANDNPQIMAAIDRVSIQKGNELGDYEDIILYYQHLESIAGRQKTEDRGQKTEDGRQKTEDRGQRTEDGLRATDYANYSQILSYSRKDREGFSKLLTGISKLGINNNLGVKDPLVDKFLNNIMRADNDEVEYFYDLLGYEIEAARAKAGDENYLAFLCNARTLFCKVYDFLDKEDDLKKVKKRIDVVKEQLKQGYDVFGNEKKLSVIGYQLSDKKKIRKSQERKLSKAGEVEETPEIKLEDLLMLADWKLKQRDYKTANTNYYLASLIATGTFANMEYDGTTMENAGIIGMIKTTLKIKPKLQVSNYKFQLNNSYRAAELTLLLYQKATNDEQRAEYNMEATISILPKAHLELLKFIEKKTQIYTKKKDFENVLLLLKEYEKRKSELSPLLYNIWIAILFYENKTEDSFDVCISALNNVSSYDKKRYQELCMELYVWASNSSLLKYENSILAVEIAPYLKSWNPASGSIKMRKALNWINTYLPREKSIRNAINNNDFKLAIDIITNCHDVNFRDANLLRLARMYLKIRNTNKSKEINQKFCEYKLNFVKKMFKQTKGIFNCEDDYKFLNCITNFDSLE